MKTSLCLRYVKSDSTRYNISGLFDFLIKYSTNRAVKFQFWLRMCKSDSCFISSISKLRHHRLSRKYNLHIPYDTEIGYGLYIAHGMGIAVNKTAKIGNNVNLSQFVTIGSNHENAAIIGDNVYIAPNVCIVEKVNIGNTVIIGAGSIVTKSINENSVCAGNPAKIIKSLEHNPYIKNPYV